MRQILSNLLNNAAQHGDQGAQVLLSADGEEDSIVRVITNFGSVIPADALRVIFEPLVQVPVTTSDFNRRPTTSLGLGLFIVREIVLGHGGSRPDTNLLSTLVRTYDVEVLVAGGAADVDSIRHLRDAGVAGVILGEALLSGSIDFAAAMEAAA